MLKLKVNSKINLSLDITGKREDGYHLLDMVMSSVNLSDIVTLQKREDKVVNIKYSTGVFFQNDICLKAVKMLTEKYDFCGADIYIEKNIPDKSGLGGSSSDASGVIYGLAKLNNFDIKNINLLDIMSIGSDVLYMLYGGTRRVKGTGNIISNRIEVPKMNFVLLTDNKGVDTKVSYYNYNYGYNRCDNDKLISYLQQGNEEKASKCFNNVLYDSSKHLNEFIDDKVDILHSLGLHAFMTGSGSGVVGYIKKDMNINNFKEILKEKCQNKYEIYYLNNVDNGIEILD